MPKPFDNLHSKNIINTPQKTSRIHSKSKQSHHRHTQYDDTQVIPELDLGSITSIDTATSGLDNRLVSEVTPPASSLLKRSRSYKNKHTQAGPVLANHIFETIKEDIVSGKIAQGSKIVEAEFAKEFKTSRGPLREALYRLEQTNLVVRTPHSRSEVIQLTHNLMKEVYQMRKILEGFATRLACEVMNEGDIANLEHIITKHQHDIDKNNGRNYWQEEGDMDFHYAIYSKCGSHLIIDYLSNKLYQITRMCRRHISGIKQRSRTGFLEHQSIVNAIKNKDGEFAEILMRRHIQSAWLSIESAFHQQSF